MVVQDAAGRAGDGGRVPEARDDAERGQTDVPWSLGRERGPPSPGSSPEKLTSDLWPLSSQGRPLVEGALGGNV